MVSDRQNKGVVFPLLDKLTSKIGTFRRFGQNYWGLPIDIPRNVRFSDIFLLTSISLVLPSLFVLSAWYRVNFGPTMARCTSCNLNLRTCRSKKNSSESRSDEFLQLSSMSSTFSDISFD